MQGKDPGVVPVVTDGQIAAATKTGAQRGHVCQCRSVRIDLAVGLASSARHIAHQPIQAVFVWPGNIAVSVARAFFHCWSIHFRASCRGGTVVEHQIPFTSDLGVQRRGHGFVFVVIFHRT